ncbi:hypothetical protein CHARACLAT_022025 [Characodon lateralis]|uniref:Secreted protein n=1 Tax=Characodon lateralis TaxID=208331 RepID=A0ABU7CQ95_9TELE|nr:hypothetical protein [Characodon lateralis]
MVTKHTLSLSRPLGLPRLVLCILRWALVGALAHRRGWVLGLIHCPFGLGAAAPVLYRQPTSVQGIWLPRGYALFLSAWGCCDLLEPSPSVCCFSWVLCVAGLLQFSLL